MGRRWGHRLAAVLGLLAITAPAGAEVLPATMAVPAAGSALAPAAASEDGRAGPAAMLLAIDPDHIVLEWQAPPYELTRAPASQAYDQVVVPGCVPAGRPGEPELPVCTVLLGVPPDAALQVRVLEAETSPVPGVWQIAPVAEQAIEDDLPPEPEEPPQIRSRRLAGTAYASDGLFPSSPAILGEPAFLRHQRFVSLAFYPLQYRPRSRALYYHSRLRVEVTFTGAAEPMGDVAEPPEFERLLERTLLNYSQAREWRRTRALPLDLPPVPPEPGYRIPVREEGLYRLTYEWLRDNGVPVAEIGDARTLRLLRYGQEVAIRVLGEEDGVFGPGDAILFYGRPIRRNRYTDSEYYWLTYNGPLGRRMPQRDGTPHGSAPVPASFVVTEHREVNYWYYSYIPFRPDHDHWFWNYTFPQGGLTEQSYAFPAHPLAAESYTATLRVYLDSHSQDSTVNPDHHIRIFLNDSLIAEQWWDGQMDLTLTLSPDSSLLQPDGNTVRIQNPGDTGAIEFILYDWLELGQRRRFVAEGGRLDWEGVAGQWEYHLQGFPQAEIFLLDVSDADGPIEIVSATVIPAGSSYDLHFEDNVGQTTAYTARAAGQMLVPASISPSTPAALRDPAGGADYIVITHGDFAAQAQALASLRAGQGRRSLAVDIQDVYDLFSYGRRVPEAIHDFLAYAYANWSPPAPSHVVLLGDGHYDPKNYRGYGMGEFILPYLAFADPWGGEVAADNRYVCVSGPDNFPDMYLGRLPANTADEAQVMVNKIIAYESAPPPGDWRRQALFIADNADDGGDFAALSDALIAGFYPSPYEAERVYLGVTHPYENPSVAARNAIIAAINQGKLLVNYIGHGGVYLWANEYLLDNPDLADLANGPLLPVALPMTCYEGAYHYIHTNPARFSLAETFLRAEGKGWIASWSPTGLGTSTGHHYLDEGFFQAVLSDDVRRLGPATMAGKLRLWQAGSWLDLLDTYLLLGDPALEMPLLPTDLALDKAAAQVEIPLQPGDALTFTLRLAAAGPATAHHIVLTDTLSPYIVSPTVRAAGLALTPRPGTRYVWDVADLAAGQSGTVTVSARLSWQTPAGLLVNQARVTTTAKEPDTQNNADLVTWLVIPGPPYAIDVTADPPALPADGTSLSLIRALVTDTAGNPVADGTPITLTTDAGTFFDGGTVYHGQTFQGAAAVFLRAAGQVVTATVTATSGQATGQVQVPFVSVAPHTILVEAQPAAIPVTGTAQITATVLDVLGHPVQDGTAVTFTTSLGTLTPTVGATVAGIARSTLHGDGLAGLATILARSGNAAGTATVRIGSGSSFTLTLTADPAAIPADGQSRSTITAVLERADGQPITLSYWISFSTTLGEIPSRSLALSGTAAVSLTAGTTVGTALVVAWAQRASGSTAVQLLPGEAATLSLSATPAILPVGGANSTLLALVHDACGNPVADGTEVAFSTTLGTVAPTLTATQDGRAFSWLTSGTQAGLATVLARAGVASGTAAVRFTALAPATLTLSADPPVVIADGISSATLSAWVGDVFGNPVEDGTVVHFFTNLGSLRPGQVGTLGGWAGATLTGTQVGTATVQALVGGVEAQAEVFFVPGPPAHLLVTAWPDRLYADGVSTATITAYLWDILGHPVADGTPVSFSTTLGTIEPTTLPAQGGRAVATLRSSREIGRATVEVRSAPASAQVAVEFYARRVYLPLVWQASP